MCVVATVAYRVEMMTTLKIRKNCFSLKVPIQPCRPMSDQALLKSFNTFQAKIAQSKGYSSPSWGPFQPLGPNQH